MIIEIKERGKDSFYDEFLYVLNNYKKILKNPNVLDYDPKENWRIKKC